MALTTRPVVGDPGWRLSTVDGWLVASAGSDQTYLVDDVPGEVAAELQACWSSQPPRLEQLSAPARLAVAELESLGVLGPDLDLTSGFTTAVRFAGEPLPGLVAALGATRELSDPDQAQVVVEVRTTTTVMGWAEAAVADLERGAVLLGVDLAASHTVALGPLVVAGHTACLSCLAGRISRRWGDLLPPPAPKATAADGVLVASGLVERQLRLLAEGQFPLADRTCSISLVDLSSESSACLRSSRCPVCSLPLGDGRLELPWL